MNSSPVTFLVIFGITGDLAQRKLIPALVHLAREGYLDQVRIVGISRRAVTERDVLSAAAAQVIGGQLELVTMDVAEPEEYRRLSEILTRLAAAAPGAAHILYYLSVPPHASLPIVELLGRAGLNGPEAKVLLEKPFGVDLPSAEEATERIGQYFQEAQLYRIDHYLAKEMAQNLIAFRSRNAIFRHLWSSEFIERIEIIASETIGVEGRAAFYEQTGALRDVVQNHLLQLAALVLMDVSHGLTEAQIPERRLQALQAIEPIRPDRFDQLVWRGQYEGYGEEVGNPGSLTETGAVVTLQSGDPRWRGVPIRLIAGKQLAARTTEIRVYFRRTHTAESNRLVMHIQPKEGVEIDLVAKKPGYAKGYEQLLLGFDYRAQAGRPIEAYERVLVDALTSDKSLFTTADEVLAAWRILQPVQERWAFAGDALPTYAPGTTIEELLEKLAPNPHTTT